MFTDLKSCVYYILSMGNHDSSRRSTKKNNKKDTWNLYGKNTSRGLRFKFDLPMAPLPPQSQSQAQAQAQAQVQNPPSPLRRHR